MNKKVFIGITLFVLFSFVLNKEAISWEPTVTHRDMSLYAAENSVLSEDRDDYLKNLGFEKGLKEFLKLGNDNKKIKDWITKGANLEDSFSFWKDIVFGDARAENHFHNPLKTWPEAGLNDIKTGESSLWWAQDGLEQENYREGDWSWKKVREYYYLALTSTTNAERQENFARTFRGVGHQMHLIQDTAQPEHVRNDVHISSRFEAWAADAIPDLTALKAFAPNPQFPEMSLDPSQFTLDPSYYTRNLVPSALFLDTNQYDKDNPSDFFTTNLATSLTIGITEYTNANFASPDTIFKEALPTDDKHYFPYPNKASTNLQYLIDRSSLDVVKYVEAEDGVQEPSLYIKKERDGEIINHFVKPKYTTRGRWDLVGGGIEYKLDYYLDKECFEEYASKLIPRAVGYSAGLLDYFFRGKIEITLPDTGVYATDDSGAGFTSITLLAKNVTPDDEEMTDGSIELVVKYRLALEDPFRNYPPDYPFQAEEEFSYIVIPELNNTRSIPRDTIVELIFNLTQNPIPLWAIDVYLQVVYKGRLGNEDNAVAVGFKDISEPTPVDFFNDMDKICLNNNPNLYTAGSPEAIDVVDKDPIIGNNNEIADEWDVYAHDVKDIYDRISPINDPHYASPADYNFVVSYLNAGEFLRALFILTDYKFYENNYSTWVRKDPSDPWLHSSSSSGLYYNTAIMNQTVHYTELEDEALCAPYGGVPCYIWWYPTFLEYRGYLIWWGGGTMFINSAYPASTECSCYEGILRTCPSQGSTSSLAETLSSEGGLMQQGTTRMQSPFDFQEGISGTMPPVSP